MLLYYLLTELNFFPFVFNDHFILLFSCLHAFVVVVCVCACVFAHFIVFVSVNRVYMRACVCVCVDNRG